MKLLLSGGGSPNKTKNIDKKFIELCGNKTILYIPIAKKTRPFEDCYNWIKNIFESLGSKSEVVMWTELSNKSLAQVKNFGGICIGGGNTFALLEELKESGFDKVLKEALSEDIVIYGISAGAVIFGKDISIALEAGDLNLNNLEDFSSLDVLDRKNIWPHYSEEYKNRLNSLIEEGNKIITLEEGEGLLIEENKKTRISPSFDNNC
jgi:dipeptidase E